jgi:hypothetical protein
MRAEVENKKGRGPLRNLALRPRPVQLQVRPGAESRKGRARMVNPGVLLRADLPLELSKVRENQRVERKRGRKLLPHLAILLQDRLNLRETTAPERSGAALTVVAAVSAAKLLGYGSESIRLPPRKLKQLRNLHRI